MDTNFTFQNSSVEKAMQSFITSNDPDVRRMALRAMALAQQGDGVITSDLINLAITLVNEETK